MGELTENIRTFALSNELQLYTLKMQYCYDIWNRVGNMTDLNGDVVTYSLNKGGNPMNVADKKNKIPYNILTA